MKQREIDVLRTVQYCNPPKLYFGEESLQALSAKFVTILRNIV